MGSQGARDRLNSLYERMITDRQTRKCEPRGQICPRTCPTARSAAIIHPGRRHEAGDACPSFCQKGSDALSSFARLPADLSLGRGPRRLLVRTTGGGRSRPIAERPRLCRHSIRGRRLAHNIFSMTIDSLGPRRLCPGRVTCEFSSTPTMMAWLNRTSNLPMPRPRCAGLFFFRTRPVLHGGRRALAISGQGPE